MLWSEEPGEVNDSLLSFPGDWSKFLVSGVAENNEGVGGQQERLKV